MKKFKVAFMASLLAAGLGLSLAFKTAETSPPALSEKQIAMVADWERAKAYTLEYVNASKDEMLTFKPTPEMRTFAQQFLHLSEANFGMGAAAGGKSSPYDWGALEKSDKYNTKAALAKIVGESYDFVIAAIKDSNDQKLAETITVFNFKLTREVTFSKVFEHQTHHRGQSVVYLRLSGIKPPDEKLF
jgi:uncharacterized damage-inducible protein DinB